MKYLLLFLLLCLIFSCDLNENTVQPPQTTLKLLNAYNLDIPEPSGLTYDEFNNCLWTVSDNTNKIYQIDFTGNILQSLSFVGNDLEGICFSNTTNSLWIVEEEPRNLVNLDLEGNEIQRFQQIIPGYDNSGLEGVCINSEDNIFLVKEKRPSQLISLESNFAVSNILEIDFAGDLSGMCATINNSIWLVSDQEETLYEITPQGTIVQDFALDISKPEGVAFLETNQEFYIVSDSENKLYHYQLISK
jgi:uncharacterized protein YjiK